MEDTKIDSELKEIILQRILSSKLPKNIQLSIGNLTHAPMDIEEIAEHVKNEDEIGKRIIEMEIAFLRALKEGVVSKI